MLKRELSVPWEKTWFCSKVLASRPDATKLINLNLVVNVGLGVMPIHLFRRACVRGIITVCLFFYVQAQIAGSATPSVVS